MKKNIILLLILFTSLCVSAQVKHEISIEGGVGYSTLIYKPLMGTRGGGLGGELGFGYTYFFGEQWGFHTGIFSGYYNAMAKLDGLSFITKDLSDSESDKFDMHTSCIKYRENQNAIYLNIPLMLQFQTKSTHPFYALAGFKVGFPLYGNHKTKNASILNEGYYHKTENWADCQEFAGFGTFNDFSSKGKLGFKTTIMIAIEAGMKWNKDKKTPIYTGIYFDYGLTNVANNENRPFIFYAPYGEPVFTTNYALPRMSEKVNIMAVGIKVKVLLMAK